MSKSTPLSFPLLVDSLLQEGLPEEFLDEVVTISITRSSAVAKPRYHAARRQRCPEALRGEAPRDVSLRTVVEAPCVCLVFQIMEEYYWVNFVQASPAAALVAGAWRGLEVVTAMERLAKRYLSETARTPAVGSAAKLRSRAWQADVLLAQTIVKGVGPGEEFALALRERIKTALASLLAATQATTEKHKATLRERIQRKLVPTSWEGELPEVDETPLLIGMSPRRGGPNRLADEVITAYTVASSPQGTLLHAPRYVHEFILRTYTPGTMGYILIQGVPAPEEALVETVAGLWNPLDKGALKDLNKAVAAAKAV